MPWFIMKQEVKRVLVEKKAGFAIEAKALLADLKTNLAIHKLKDVRVLNRYDVSGITEEEFLLACTLIMSEPPVDTVYKNQLPEEKDSHIFAVEYLPGQYDQRADSTAQCIQLIAEKENILVQTAKVYILYGDIGLEDIEKIKQYLINPIESRETGLAIPASLVMQTSEPEAVKRLSGFITMNKTQLTALVADMGLAMKHEDVKFCQEYFIKERRDPSITELKMLDTYWSDHCRHTTFNTIIDDIEIVPHRFTQPMQVAWELYQQDRQTIYGGRDDKPVTLMDIAVMGMKKLKAEGKLDDLDESEEVNACSIAVPVKIGDTVEEWLVMFKNETHNHPTEIEPFGGAATCLGGAIRDPLSGRAYVYQAMRVTGGADPRAAIEETMEGKLPQRKIALGAAAGYSSYGNQIGLSTGRVQEFYHERFLAKRMELGALIGAVPSAHVVRAIPEPGDHVILLGGRTGRDGCGGATGSSKEHTVDSLQNCGAEVQKGNPPTERKILRLFRDPVVTKMIKRCNDFGAGGVSVAIGELADGVKINLDNVPKKYDGLDGTELAISESQERMAVVVAEKDSAEFINMAIRENLEATVVAEVTAEKRVVMQWRGDTIVNIARDFLNTGGVRQHANVTVKPPANKSYFESLPYELSGSMEDLKECWLNNLKRLEVCSQKGVAERFDSTIGRGTVVMPLGGSSQLTPSEGMAANIPSQSDDVKTATVMTYGYNPELACWSPFHGALYAVLESVCRATALGADPEKVRLSLQEYFEKMINSDSWGKPFAALMGAYLAQVGLDIPAIGGKDSMSGTFMNINVPPTLVSFAVGIADTADIVSNEFKKSGSRVLFITAERDETELPDFAALKLQLQAIHAAIKGKNILSAATIKEGGIASCISTMCLGNGLGFEFTNYINDMADLFIPQPAGFILELAETAVADELFPDMEWVILGATTQKPAILLNDVNIPLQKVREVWEQPLSNIYPVCQQPGGGKLAENLYTKGKPGKYTVKIVKPRVFIPVFPGTNCEYDVQRAFASAGADTDLLVVRNLDSKAIKESVEEMAKRIGTAEIVALAGGFSAGDEPDGSGKFIATMFRNAHLKEAITKLLEERGGLMLGICNGFQALIKLGLLPYGRITDMTEKSPTLSFNYIGRHVSTMCRTKVVSNLSPWLSLSKTGDLHTVAVSSGEGRFYAEQADMEKLFAAGQVMTQYVDADDDATMEAPYNPNGSLMAVESLCSPDGRIFGKMCHSERYTDGLFINIPGNKDQNIFKAGVDYFNW